MKKILEQCPLFAGIAENELEGILGCLGAGTKRFQKGEWILKEGETAQRMGVVIRGSAQVIRENFDGSRSILTRLEAGDLFAEVFVCAGVKRMPVSVAAVENCEVLLMDGTMLLHTCSNACSFHQQIIFNLMKILATKNLMCNQKIEITSRRTTREKLMAYLLLEAKKAQSSTFVIPYDRQELADYLEVDRSGLSAEISKMRREGILQCEKNRFALLREEA